MNETNAKEICTATDETSKRCECVARIYGETAVLGGTDGITTVTATGYSGAGGGNWYEFACNSCPHCHGTGLRIVAADTRESIIATIMAVECKDGTHWSRSSAAEIVDAYAGRGVWLNYEEPWRNIGERIKALPPRSGFARTNGVDTRVTPPKPTVTMHVNHGMEFSHASMAAAYAALAAHSTAIQTHPDTIALRKMTAERDCLCAQLDELTAAHKPSHIDGESLFIIDAWLSTLVRRPGAEAAAREIDAVRLKIRETFAAMMELRAAGDRAWKLYVESVDPVRRRAFLASVADKSSPLRFDIQDGSEV
jgi:hypothetical protein